jgi:hypothetical protein
MISFTCIHCGMKVKVKNELAGCKAKCPTCKRPIVVLRTPEQLTALPGSRESERTGIALPEEQSRHLSTSAEQIEHVEKNLADVKALQQTLVAVERELGEYHELLSRKLASLEDRQEDALPGAEAVADCKPKPSAAVPKPSRDVPAPPAPPPSKDPVPLPSTPKYYYVSRLSPKTGKSYPTEIDESDFPSELRKRRPDQDDVLYTKMVGYAMERVWGRFQREILGGWAVYSTISDDWRLSSWLKAP